MHCLDRYINDIEPRLEAIISNIPKQEEPSLQASLASYGWILLDAWVAWRTMRYLLKETPINDEVQDKWLQTPSSYTANQLRAAWNFKDSTLEYLHEVTGKKFNYLIDKTIQLKRNSSAHFNRKSDITGADALELKSIFTQLSFVFLAYEVTSFVTKINTTLARFNYQDFEISLDGQVLSEGIEINDDINSYSRAKSITIKCFDNNGNCYEYESDHDGFHARKVINETSEWKDVINEIVPQYSIWGNKGFYLDIDLLCNTIRNCWE